MAQEPKILVRVIGRWSLAALMLNTVIGASVFGLPSLLAARLGKFSPLGYVVTAIGIGAVAVCLAEVGSQFREAGGPYLYAKVAFGSFAAIQIGWLTWLTRIVAAAAAADLFVSYLARFVPGAENWMPRAMVLALLIGSLAAANYFGVTTGARVSNLFTIVKLLVIGLFVVAGLLALWLYPAIRAVPATVSATKTDWYEAILLMINSFGGFEAALFLSGETRDPRRDAPISLFIALTAVTVLYAAVQWIVIYTLPDAAAAATPVSEAAQRFLGPVGAWIIAMGALISVYGYLSANLLHTPRLTFAMGEQRDFPRVFAAIHPRFRTPYVSIASFAVLLFVFAIAGSFAWNAILSAVSRLFIYASVAAAVPVLRKKRPNAAAFRVPGAMFFVAIVLVATGVLATRIPRRGVEILLVTMAIASVNWFWSMRSAKAGTGYASAEDR
ncbi:MAG TPA: amino acid permease [Terriglobales bacterium]|nr:amino acid permease [Terriglobales bacterium]